MDSSPTRGLFYSAVHHSDDGMRSGQVQRMKTPIHPRYSSLSHSLLIVVLFSSFKLALHDYVFWYFWRTFFFILHFVNLSLVFEIGYMLPRSNTYSSIYGRHIICAAIRNNENILSDGYYIFFRRFSAQVIWENLVSAVSIFFFFFV